MVHFSIPRCKATLKIYNTFKELILLCFYSPSVCKEKKHFNLHFDYVKDKIWNS